MKAAITTDLARALIRHFTLATSQFESKTWTSNPADPTEVCKSQGWVTFLYDPFGDPEEHEIEMATYHLTIVDAHGFVTIEIARELGEGFWATKSTSLVLNASDFDEISQVDFRELDQLLDGIFHASHKDVPDYMEF